jgi:hypothetical protein
LHEFLDLGALALHGSLDPNHDVLVNGPQFTLQGLNGIAALLFARYLEIFDRVEQTGLRDLDLGGEEVEHVSLVAKLEIAGEVEEGLLALLVALDLGFQDFAGLGGEKFLHFSPQT